MGDITGQGNYVKVKKVIFSLFTTNIFFKKQLGSDPSHKVSQVLFNFFSVSPKGSLKRVFFFFGKAIKVELSYKQIIANCLNATKRIIL